LYQNDFWDSAVHPMEAYEKTLSLKKNKGVASMQFPEIPDEIKKLLAQGEKIDEIRLDAEGNWFHNGQPFTNQRIIDFFNKSINITKDGTYVIHYAQFTYPIVVEDAPIFVTGVRFKGFADFETVILTLSTGQEEELDVSTLHVRKGKELYCYVRNNTMLAKFKRSASFTILDRLEETDDIFYLTIAGKKIVLEEKLS